MQRRERLGFPLAGTATLEVSLPRYPWLAPDFTHRNMYAAVKRVATLPVCTRTWTVCCVTGRLSPWFRGCHQASTCKSCQDRVGMSSVWTYRDHPSQVQAQG